MQRKIAVPLPGGRVGEAWLDRGPGAGVPRRTIEFGIAMGGPGGRVASGGGKRSSAAPPTTGSARRHA